MKILHSTECICRLHRPCKTAGTPATPKRGGAKARWITGTRRTRVPTRTRYIKDLLVFLEIAHQAFLLQGARKALGPRWSTPASLPNMMFGGGGGDQSMLNPETPSKSLLGTDTSSSMLFSPPSILKVCLIYMCKHYILVNVLSSNILLVLMTVVRNILYHG